jgi:chromosome segregation ATPase
LQKEEEIRELQGRVQEMEAALALEHGDGAGAESKEYAKLQKENMSLKQAMETSSTFKAKIIASLEEKRDELQQQLGANRSLLSSLEKEQVELKEQAQQLMVSEQGREEMQHQLDESQAIISSLEQERDELKEQVRQLTVSEQGSKKIQQQLNESQVIISSLEAIRNDLSQQVERSLASERAKEELQQQLEKKEAAVSSLEIERDGLTQQIAALTESAQKELKLQQQQQGEHEAMVSNLDVERGDLRRQEFSLQAERTELRQEIKRGMEDLKQQLDAKQTELSNLRAEHEELKEHCKRELREKLDKQRQELLQSSSTAAELATAEAGENTSKDVSDVEAKLELWKGRAKKSKEAVRAQKEILEELKGHLEVAPPFILCSVLCVALLVFNFVLSKLVPHAH